MDQFNYFFSFFGLILGLTLAEVASKFADAIDAHARRPIGILTPLLAAFVLFDISSFWLWAWSMRSAVVLGFGLTSGALVVAMAYFLSAALIFPRREGDWKTLDDHYWQRKVTVLTGVTLANVVVIGTAMVMRPPALDDTWFFIWQMIYYVPVGLLFLSRSKRIDIALLVFMLIQYQLPYLHVFPVSNWGAQSGLNGDAPKAASTSTLTPPR